MSDVETKAKLERAKELMAEALAKKPWQKSPLAEDLIDALRGTILRLEADVQSGIIADYAVKFILMHSDVMAGRAEGELSIQPIKPPKHITVSVEQAKEEEIASEQQCGTREPINFTCRDCGEGRSEQEKDVDISEEGIRCPECHQKYMDHLSLPET